MSTLIHDIREFFWPLLEGEAKHYQITSEEIQEALQEETDKDKINELLALSKSIYEHEEKRRSTVEAKATTLLGATGLTITLIVSFGKSLFFEFEKLGTLTASAFAFFFIITLLYFWRSITYSLRAISKSGPDTMMPGEILKVKETSEEEYKKKMAELILYKAAKNYPLTNVKVDWLIMSMEYFKRGIVTIILGTIVLSLLVILHWSWLHRANSSLPWVEKQKVERAETEKNDITFLKNEVNILEGENESLKKDIKDLQENMGNLLQKPGVGENSKKKAVARQ